MELGSIAQWLSFGVAGAVLVYTVFTNSSRARKAHVEEIKGDVDKLESRVRSVEHDCSITKSQIAHYPSKDMVHEITVSLTRVEGQLEKLEEGVKPLRSIAERMQDFLMAVNKK